MNDHYTQIFFFFLALLNNYEEVHDKAKIVDYKYYGVMYSNVYCATGNKFI